jgi:hypothetical protein
MPKVLLHIQNEDPVVGEMDTLPSLQDTMVMLKHPTRRDGKDIPYLEQSVSMVIWPMSRVNYIEILPSSEEEDIITFIRE